MSMKTELKIHGFNACIAVFKRRPEGIVRVYLTQARMKVLSDLVKYCVDKRKAYHVCSPEELAKVADASHHEGVCLVIKLPALPDAQALTQLTSKPGCWLALEDVGNPHNLGAIFRSAAHFGVTGVFLVAPKTSWETGAFYRTAEGGAEAVPVVPVESLDELKALTQELGLELYATSGHKGSDLYQTKLPPKTVFLLGAEGPGLTNEAMLGSKKIVRIPGTGAVESLNVAQAGTVLAAEWFRQHRG